MASFVDVVPGTSGSLSLFFGGTACSGGTQLGSASSSYTALAAPAAAFAGVLPRTLTVWQDASTLSAAYLLQDAVGRPQVLLTGLSVSLLLTGAGGSTTMSCGAPSATSGKGDCTGSVPSSWFSNSTSSTASATVSASYSGTGVVATSSPFSITLSRSPVRASIAAAGMYLSLPASPRYRGDTVGPLTVYAHTGGYALSSWTLTCTYNSTVLTYASYVSDSKFNAPTANTATAGTLSFAVTGKSSGTADAAVTGTAISLLQVSFTVASAAPGGVSAGALSCIANDLISTATLTFVSQTAASMSDDRDGWFTSGRLTVALASPIGLYAYASSAELINTAPFTGTAVTSAITAMVVLSTPNSVIDSAPSAVGFTVACNLSNVAQSGVVSVTATSTGCTASAGATATAGASSVPLLISAGNLSFAGASLRVWAPVSANVFSSDYTVSPIANANRTGACSNPLYQSVQLQLVATFGGAGLVSMPQLDMTCMPGVTFVSSNTSVVSISGTTATGLSPGTASVSVGAYAVSLTVVSGPRVTVTSLGTYLLTGATWSGVPASVALSANANFTASANVVQTLTAEGASGTVAVFATYSDGTTSQVTQGLNVSVAAAYASTLSVATSSGVTTATVVVGATSINASNVLNAVWSDFCSGSVIGNGTGAVAVAMPPALYVNMTPAGATLAAPGSPAAAAPVSRATSVQLGVTLTFSGPTVRTMTSDPRTLYTITAGASLASVSSTGLVSIFANATSGGVVTVTATFPTYSSASSMSASQSFTVVRLSSLSVTASPFPSFSGSTSLNVTTLRLVHCTSSYQRATPKLVATLSDGSVTDVTSASTFTSSAPSVLNVSSSQLWGVAAGTASVVGTFSGVASAGTTFAVSNTPAAITALAVTLAAGTTFSGQSGATSALAVAVTFNDGTQFTDAVSGASNAWVSPQSLLSFASSNPGVVGVSAAGVATLYANAPATVTLSAAGLCSSGAVTGAAVNASVAVSPNLTPAVFDVDLGSSSGLQFPAVSSGGTLSVPVIINSGAGNLLSFQVTVVWDTNLFSAVSCTSGSAWSSYLFACTTGNPANQALLVGSSASTTASGAALQVGVLTLRATSSSAPAVTAINGTIAVLITTANGAGVSPTAIVAGSGSVSVNGGVAAALPAPSRRRLLLSDASRMLLATPPASCAALYGDTNADCKFDAADVLFVQRFLVAQAGYTNLSTLTTWQRQQTDPTLDYLNPSFSASACGALGAYGVPCPTGADAQYLLYAVAKKARFLVTPPAAVLAPPTVRGGALGLGVVLYDDTNSPAPCGNLTRVRFEVGLAAGSNSPNAALAFSVGTNVNATAAGFIVTAACTSAGVYTANASATSATAVEAYWAVAVLIGACGACCKDRTCNSRARVFD